MRRITFVLLFVLALAAGAAAQTTHLLTSATCPGTGCVAVTVRGQGSVGIQVTGTFVGTLQFEQSLDGQTWVTLAALPNGLTATVTSATAPGVWTATVAGANLARVRFSAYTSGTAVVSTITAQARSNANVPILVGGVLPFAQGGLGFNTATRGDLFYASATDTPGKLADVAAGSYLRAGGVGAIPLWSTLILPNAATQYRVPYATATDTWGESGDLTFVPPTVTFGASATYDPIAITPGAKGAGAFVGTIASADLTRTRTWTWPDLDVTAADLTKIVGITNGTGAANKAVVLDTNADITAGWRDLRLVGSSTLATGGIYRIEMATPAAPTLATNQSGTDLAAGDYKITVVAVGQGGGVTLYPAAVTQTVGAGGAGRIVVTYVAPTGATAIRVYVSTMGGATPDRYFTSTSASTYNINTLTGATVAALPTAATAYRFSVGGSTNWMGAPFIYGGLLALGTTTAAGLTLQNLSTAAAGAQQYSPSFSQIGQGWSTNAGGASMPVETRWELRPVQGAASPTFTYVLMGRINNAAWVDIATFYNVGTFMASTIAATNLALGAAGQFYWQGRTIGTSPVNGTVSLQVNDLSAGIRFQFAAAPTIASGFGTTPSITAGSTDTAGQVDVGTGGAASSGVIDFATTWASAPFVVAMNQTNAVVLKAVATTTQLTITGAAAFTAGDKINWICIGAK